MEIEFVGGAQTVTGSSFIVKDSDYTIMVDCGMFQGKHELKERNYLHSIYAPQKIDAILLTHAHIDHSGLVPKLVKEGFYGNIYATKATADLCSIMLPDSAHIQEMDTEFINRKNRKLNRPPVEPLYTVDDAEKALENFVAVNYGERIQIHPRIHIRFRDAGHILGSAFIEMWIEEDGSETKIVFSGDLGISDQALIRDPEPIEDADILLIESTYGNRLHKSKPDTYVEFKETINEAHNKRGNIIIPSFAVGRTQELIYTLGQLKKNNEIPDLPVYIDSPLAISATEVFRSNSDYFDDQTKKMILSGNSPLSFPNLHFTRSADESKQLCEEAKGSIIISASGMCTAGRIKYHLQHNLFKPASSIVFVGYQAEGTLGRRIIEGAKQVRVYGMDVSVNAKIVTLGGFSAHADRDQLLKWMSGIKNPKLKVFVVHGESSTISSFADTIQKELGFQVYAPAWGEIVDVATMRSRRASYSAAAFRDTIEHDIEALYRSLGLFKEKIDKIKNEKAIIDGQTLHDDINDVKEMLAMIIDEL